MAPVNEDQELAELVSRVAKKLTYEEDEEEKDNTRNHCSECNEDCFDANLHDYKMGPSGHDLAADDEMQN